MTTNFDKVIQFHTSFGLPYSKTVNQQLLHDFKTVSLRVKLLDEEYGELFNSKTIVDQLDAIGDLLYVAYGAGICFGFDMNTEYENYCTKLISQRIIPDTFHALSNFRKTIFMYDFLKSSIDLDSKNPREILYAQIIDFQYQIKKFSYALLMCDTNGVVQSLVKMLFSLYISGVICHYDLDMLFDIIHQSNMSKLCSSENEAKKSVEWYVEHEKQRYTQPKYERSPDGKYYVIFDDATGKRLKSINFVVPKIDVNKIYSPTL